MFNATQGVKHLDAFRLRLLCSCQCPAGLSQVEAGFVIFINFPSLDLIFINFTSIDLIFSNLILIDLIFINLILFDLIFTNLISINRSILSTIFNLIPSRTSQVGESPVLWRLSKPFTRLVKVIIRLVKVIIKPFTRLVKVIIKVILRSAKLVIASSDTLAAFCEGKPPQRFHAVAI